MTDQRLKHIAIIGGGSAGWMAAAATANALHGNCNITLVESEEIGAIGVGEATIPPIQAFNARLGINENDFLKATHGSFKLGIEFVNWGRQGQRYFHPFGEYGATFDNIPIHHYWLYAKKHGLDISLDDFSFAWNAAKGGKFGQPSKDPRKVESTFDYAYHFDAILYGRFLRTYAEKLGVKRIEGKVVDVSLDGETGFVKSVKLENNDTVEADFFIDCTGFFGLLIEKTLKTGYVDWTHWLPCNRAIAVPCESTGEFTPYTRSTAREAGWQWRIPLQHRTGNGYVYCSEYLSSDEAEATLMDNLDGKAMADPRHLGFTTGRRKKFWNKNVVAIGLSAGFMEPLESTSLHLIQSAIQRLLALLPDKTMNICMADEFNRLTINEYERCRDFIILHYKACEREDAELWKYTKNMSIPDELQYKIDQFKACGNIVANDMELFRNPSWLAVYIGQNIIPESYAPILDMSTINIVNTMENLNKVMRETAATMPSHQEYIDRYCKLASPAM